MDGPAEDSRITNDHPTWGDAGLLLSAQERFPDVSFLTVSVASSTALSGHWERLLQMRDPLQVATALRQFDTHLPEPQAAIWEPRSRSAILSGISGGVTCLRRILSQSRVQLVESV